MQAAEAVDYHGDQYQDEERDERYEQGGADAEQNDDDIIVHGHALDRLARLVQVVVADHIVLGPDAVHAVKHEVCEPVLFYELLWIAVSILVVAVEAEDQDGRHDVKHEVLYRSVGIESAFPVSVLVYPSLVLGRVDACVRIFDYADFVGGLVYEEGRQQVHPEYHEVDYVALVF